jgi:CRISPR/Cas system CSM-associated protein Csm3 (group 7 of RAMP superfamily)
MKREEPAPKPYKLISFPPGSPQRAAPAGHAQLLAQGHTGWLDIWFETLTPVQVASGITDFVRAGGQDQLALVQITLDRYADDDSGKIVSKAVLPGSSIKGALRSLVETLSPSCVLVYNRFTRSAVPRRLSSCGGAHSLCPACRLFGAQDYQGQLSFADALVPDGFLSLLGVPLLWQPARSEGRGLPGRYLAGQEAAGRKLYEHREPASGPDPRLVIREGASIPFRLSFTNLTAAELGLLLTALGQHPDKPFFIKLGAGKPVGLGSIEAKIKTVALITGRDAIRKAGRLGKANERGEKLEGAALAERIKQWTKQATEEQLLLAKQLEEVAETLRRENLYQPAPSGLY